MRKILLLMVVVILLFSGCSSTDIMDDSLKGSKNESESAKGSVDLEYFEFESGPLSKPDDTENNINAERLSEDIQITKQAEELDITEYDVVINASDKDILPQSSAGGENYEILEVYNTTIPDELELNLIYEMYNVAFDYAIAMSDNINIRTAPTTSSSIIGTAHSLEKLNLVAKVRGQYLDSYGSDIWYQIAWNDINTVKTGYIFGSLVDIRRFNFDSMLESVKKLKKHTDDNIIAYISNYKDRNGEAPLHNGNEKDDFGTSRYQSAPAYYEPSTGSDFRYIPDGMIVSLLDETENYFRVSVPAYGEEYYVPKKYLSMWNSITDLKQVVVIDRTNQNQAVFQYFDGKWQIVSYTYATTGGDQNYMYPTEKGFFNVLGKREKFEYLDSGSGEILGYAPYAVRFSGSSYIHGIPVENANSDEESDNSRYNEYLFTLGTFPRTNGSVRNYTSHAQFLYEWLNIGESAVIVID